MIHRIHRPSAVKIAATTDSSLLLCHLSAEGAFPLAEIIAARTPHAWMAKGGLSELLPHDPGEVACLSRAVADGRPSVWVTPTGVGRLMPYAPEAGVWLLVHISLPIHVAHRLVAAWPADDGHIVLRPSVQDIGEAALTLRPAEAERLTAAWQWLTWWDDECCPCTPDVAGTATEDVMAAIERMAGAVGCVAKGKEIPRDLMTCHLPSLWEVSVLALLCCARVYAPTRTLTYTLRVTGNDAVAPTAAVPTAAVPTAAVPTALRMEVTCMLPTADTPTEALLPGLNYLRRVTEAQGGVCLSTRSAPYKYINVGHTVGLCCDLAVTITCPQPPTETPWSDFKHPEKRQR